MGRRPFLEDKSIRAAQPNAPTCRTDGLYDLSSISGATSSRTGNWCWANKLFSPGSHACARHQSKAKSGFTLPSPVPTYVCMYYIVVASRVSKCGKPKYAFCRVLYFQGTGNTTTGGPANAQYTAEILCDWKLLRMCSVVPRLACFEQDSRCCSTAQALGLCLTMSRPID